MSDLHEVGGTFVRVLAGEIHWCPEPCECCELLIAPEGFGVRPRFWVERFVNDGLFCFMSEVVHTPKRCRAWRRGEEPGQGLGGRTMVEVL